MRKETRQMKATTGPGIEWLLFILIICFIPFSPLYSQADDLAPVTSQPDKMTGDEGHSPVIRAIEVRGLTRIEEGELIDLICFDIGDTLNRQELSTGIRRAFKKGIFQDIKVEYEDYDGGVKLIYAVKEIPLVKEIIIDGNQYLRGTTIKERYFFKEGGDYKEEYLDKSRLDLLEFYRRRGYPDVKVEIAVERLDDKALVNIHINIEEGAPLIIEKIDAPWEVAYLIRAGAGSILNMDELDKDMKAIEDYYRKKYYIKPVAGPYHFSDGELTVPVFPGTRLEIKFKNNIAISDGKLEKELSFIENEDVSDESVAETADRIKRLYVSTGYYYAQVAAGVERDDDVIRITFIIFEGEKVVLKKISFSGTGINPEGVKKVLPFAENKPFNNNLIDESKVALVRFYNALGYLHADVVEIKKEFQGDGRELNLEYVIDEGVQTKITAVEITGNKQIDELQIREALNLKEDVPYNVIDIGDARRRALALYGRYGYLDAVVDGESVIDNGKAFLTFRITENRPSVVGKIILHGNQKTKAKIIMREITLHEGAPYNLEDITKIKQRLYKLGIFSEVSIDVLDGGRETDGKVIKDMLISLKEGKAGSVEVSIGYGDYEQVRGSLEISYRNIGGYNRQAGFRTDQNYVERRYIFNFREPWLFNWPDVPLKIFLIREERRGLNIETREVLYEIDKQSFIAGIEKEIAEGLKAGLDYEYSFTDTKDVQEDVILSREDTGTLGISSLSPSIYYDKRDDPFNPSSGSLHGVVLKYASKALLSESEFIKGTIQSSWYFQLLRPVVLAFSLRGGAARGFGESEELPLIERFFLGGRSTVRGYSHDTLGPKGADNNPTGGNVFALTNWELRYSLGKGFGLVTFIDAGNVWKTIGDVSDELKYTVGAGFRYITPVGPIRIDYGHKMNKDEGESRGEVHFSFGHAF